MAALVDMLRSVATGVACAATVVVAARLFALEAYFSCGAFVLAVWFVAHFCLAKPAAMRRREQAECVYGRRFTPKYRFSVQNNPLCAIPLVPFVKLLWYRRSYIDWQVYWFRLLFLFGMAWLQSVLGLVESVLHGAPIRETEINDRPVFILGHPRTGTTHMYNLLSLNKTEFGHCNTFMVGFPLSFVWFEKHRGILGSNILSEKRPMDNMALSWESPQEDELATNVLTSGLSPYMCITIMRGADQFYDYFDFQKPKVEAERRTWTAVFTNFLRKVQYYTNRKSSQAAGALNQNRRLLLKSPVHTSRIQLLLQLFPKAQFVYMHRDPVDVFVSAANMADTTYWYSYLNVPTDDEVIDFIVTQYRLLMKHYLRDRESVPAGNLVEVSFEELTNDPVAAVRKVYKKLGWENSFAQHMEPELLKYTESASQKKYAKNSFNRDSLSSALRRRLATEWREGFEEFGYPLVDMQQ